MTFVLTKSLTLKYAKVWRDYRTYNTSQAMKLTVNELIFKGHWLDYCELKGLNPHKVNSGEIDDQMEIELTPEEVKILNIKVPRPSVCGDSGN